MLFFVAAGFFVAVLFLVVAVCLVAAGFFAMVAFLVIGVFVAGVFGVLIFFVAASLGDGPALLEVEDIPGRLVTSGLTAWDAHRDETLAGHGL